MSSFQAVVPCGARIFYQDLDQHEENCRECATIAEQILATLKESPKPKHRAYSPPMSELRGMEGTRVAAVTGLSSLQEPVSEPVLVIAPTTEAEQMQLKIQQSIEGSLKAGNHMRLSKMLLNIQEEDAVQQTLILKIFTTCMESTLLNNTDDTGLNTVCKALGIVVEGIPSLPPLIFRRMHEQLQGRLLTQSATALQLKNLQRSLQVVLNRVMQPVWSQVTVDMGQEMLPISEVVNRWIMLAISVEEREDALPTSDYAMAPQGTQIPSPPQFSAEKSPEGIGEPLGPFFTDPYPLRPTGHVPNPSTSFQATHPAVIPYTQDDQTIVGGICSALKRKDSTGLVSFMSYMKNPTSATLTTDTLVDDVGLAFFEGPNDGPNPELHTITEAFDLFCAQDENDDFTHTLLTQQLFNKILDAISSWLADRVSREELMKLDRSLEYILSLIQAAKWASPGVKDRISQLQFLISAMLGSG